MARKGVSREHEDYQNQKALNDNKPCGPSPDVRSATFSIIYTNADSFVNKRDEMMQFLQNLDNRPAAIIITEVNPKTVVHAYKRVNSICQGTIYIVLMLV